MKGILFTFFITIIVSLLWADCISKTNWDEHNDEDFLN